MSKPKGSKARAARVTGPKNPTVAHVHGADGHIRTYSKEIHGEVFLDKAKEFAGQEADRKIVTE